ncbi:PqqD family protein [Natronospora cellulosivora (SeqCode)]
MNIKSNELLKAKISLKSHIVSEKVDKDIILYDEEKNRVITLNETAKIILQLIKSPVKYDSLVENFCSLYEEDNSPNIDEVKKDIFDMLILLYKKDLLSIS